LINKNKR